MLEVVTVDGGSAWYGRSTTGGLRERRRQTLRREIVQAAMRLFADGGYRDTTVERIASAAGVSRATFFNHFPTKDALLFADIDDQLHLDLFRQAISGRGAGEPVPDVLMRAVRQVVTADAWSVLPQGPDASVRRDLLLNVPELRSAAAARTQDLGRALALLFADTFDELDQRTAAALAGALVGAVTCAAHTAATPDEDLGEVALEAARTALYGLDRAT